MDKYTVYHNIKKVQSIATQYPDAEKVTMELNGLAQQLSSRTYRVAVIGEFNRGKSSLVNCILGTEILPTDILPATAVVNRIIYGTEQKIEIYYKNGTITNISVEELSEYATKKNEINASQIREIVVHYPAVFCQNNIELLDTPGLNDDEFMDKTTLDVLDKIDTAIVTTHASYPISETEKKLICRLIEQNDIYHLTFVATFIDRVSDDPDDQDKIVELIRKRLSKETYQIFCQKHPNEPELLEKAKQILCEPIVFAVSSRLAMRGFIAGNKKMLDESRFPHFKYELSALLTANQELDMLRKAHRLVYEVNQKYNNWHQSLLPQLDASINREKVALRAAQTYRQTGCAGLPEMLLQMDKQLQQDGILINNANTALGSDKKVQEISRIIMHDLLEADPMKSNFKQSVMLLAVQRLARADENTATLKRIRAVMHTAENYLLKSEKEVGLTGEDLGNKLRNWFTNTPQPKLSVESFTDVFDAAEMANVLQKSDIIAIANYVQQRTVQGIYAFAEDYSKKINTYISSWRSLLLKQNLADKQDMEQIAGIHAEQIRKLSHQKETLTVNDGANRRSLEAACAELQAMLNGM